MEAPKSRIGPLIALPEVLLELNVPPKRALKQAGINKHLFDDPENRISQEAICRLFSICVALTGRDDFGLLVGSRFTLGNFGPLGELMRYSSTVGDAMRMLLLHLHFYDRAAIPLMFGSESDYVFLGYSLHQPAMDGTGPLQDAAIAVAHRAVRELCGPTWRPPVVQFSHRRPESDRSYRHVFGRDVRFDAEFSGLFFEASWLEHRIAGSNPANFSRLNQTLQSARAGAPVNFVEEVRCVIHGLLAGETMSAAGVAQLFGCSERTLRHRLQAEGTSMQRLLKETRFELARHLLRGTELPIAYVATALCYADAAVFSRAFHSWAGMSPRQWRKN